MKKFLKNKGIEFYSIVPLERCKILKEYLLTKNGLDKSCNAIMMLFPYRSKITPVNLSVYASVKDYHGYVASFANELEAYMKEKHPNSVFKMFSDHSPIDEVHATCVAGLGFIGDNGLLINEKYSSFVFIGECITNLSPKELDMEYAHITEPKSCLHCGKCASLCPCGCIGNSSPNPKAQCLSAITQKKGELSEEEISLMLNNGSIWGCDICQNACPFTKNAQYSPIEYFNEDVIATLDINTLNSMTDEALSTRPFSWRGRSVIERNVLAYEKFKK